MLLLLANAGTDQTVCGVLAASLNANSVAGGNWTGGSGTFTPNRNTANATYTPAAGEIGTTITLTWNAPDPDGAGPCTSATDAMTITINAPVIANAGTDQTVCGVLAALLNANTVAGGNWTGGTGTFTPNRNTANATYTPAAGEIGTTITLTWNAPDPDGAGPCTSATDAMTITINAPVIVNAGTDQTVCGTLALSLNANTVTGGNWTGGTGTFTPNRNTANATYTPATGEIGTTITLTWNAPDPDGAGPCTSATDAMTITINAPVTASAGTDQTVCGVLAVSLNANVVTGGNWTGGSGTFNPNRNTANATYTPAAGEIGTTITLTWNAPDPDGAGPCTSATDALTITINAPVIANAGTDQTVCGVVAASLNANVVTGGNWTGGAGTFNPNRNTANATYTPAAGEIGTTITLTWNAPDPDGAGPCTSATDAMTITINAPVIANAGTDQTVCGVLAALLNANVVTGGNWTGGSGTFNPNRNTANATYTPAAGEIGTTITLTWNAPDPDGAGPCSSSSDAMNIIVNPPMIANAGADQNICGTSNVTLAANVLAGGNWTGGAGTFSPDRNTANAIYAPSAGESGTTVILTWNVPDPDGAGPCPATSDAMSIIFNTASTANAGPDQTTCGSAQVQLAALGSQGGNWTGGAGSFAPDRNTPNAIYAPSASEIGTTITLTWNVPDPDGAGPCAAVSDEMKITINSPVSASAGNDQIICGAVSISLNANVVTGGNWTGGIGTFNPNRNAANATYMPAVGEVGTTVVLSWNVPDPDGTGPCTTVSDDINITINAPATPNAGADQVTCGNANVTLAANATTGGNWTGGAGTFNPNRNTANATYTPTVGEIGSTITLTWNVPDPDGAGPCTAATDAMTITVNTAVVANAGADQTSCGASSITLAANATTGGNWTGGAGSFAPDRNTANATYTPAVGEVGSTVTLIWNVPDPDGAGPCTAATDAMTITVNAPVTANAGPDQTVCSATAVSLNANTTTGGSWTGGAGTFNPNRNTANATYTPAAGEIGTTITLTWNVPDPDGAGPCTAATDAMTITVNTPVTANAGPDQTVCSAIAVSLNANAVTGGNWTGGAGSFNPNRNTANATYTPAVGEIGSTVTLIWNVPDPDGAGPCTAATDQMNIVVNTAVVANAGADQTSCGASSITLAANATTGGNWTGGTGSFAPDRNTSNATYTPALSEIGTTITLTWNVPDPDGAGPCTAATDAMTITVNTAVVANAGADQTSCGASSITLAANATTGGNWTGGAGTFNPNRNTPNATYTPAAGEIGTTITLTWNVPDPDGAGPCTAATDQMNIVVNTAVIANAGADQTSCGASSITLAANATTGGNWTGGAGSFAPDRNIANATYTPALSEIGTTITLAWNVPDPDGAGPCTAVTDQMNITVNTAVVANAGADQISCGASSITLAANATTGGNWTGGAGTFNPNRNTANATYAPAAGEIGSTITLTWNVPDPDGAGPCTAATDQMNITVNTAVVANAGADQTSCGASSITLAANATTGGNWTGGAGSFVPDRNTANATYTPAAGEIGTTVTLTWDVPDPDGAGPCTAATDAMTITVNTAVVANAGADQTSCGASSITLAANATTGGNWTGGAGSFAPDRNTANATYTPAVGEVGSTVTLIWNVPDPDGAGPCTAATDAMTITVNAPVTANAGPDQTVCSATAVSLNANTTTGGNWTGGAGTFNPNRNTANATYTPAAGEIGTTITLTWNVPDPDGAGPCTAATDAMTITVNTPVTANAGPDQTVCSAIAVSLNANAVTGGNWTGGAGSFNPNRNTANATYTPAVGEIGSTVTLIWNVPDPDGAGPCTAATDQMNIVVNTAVVANAGADQTSCGASSITLAANATTGGNWTGGTGSFAPDRNTSNATYTPALSE
jgi:CRISPR/Cas system CSM-associated protein Csm4 (group 5 of RAMP superfamily)